MRITETSMSAYTPSAIYSRSNKVTQQSFGACNGTSCSLSRPSRGRKIAASAIGILAGLGVLCALGYAAWERLFS